MCITDLQEGNKLCTISHIYFDQSYFFMELVLGILFLNKHFGKQYSSLQQT